MQDRTVSEVIVEQLAAWGVEYIFGLPGTTCLEQKAEGYPKFAIKLN